MDIKKNYLGSIVHLRGVMTFFVVLGHALTIFVNDYAGHKMIESDVGSSLRTIIYSFHMPVFMAISGYLFYFEVDKVMHKNTFDGYGRFVLKKFKRLLVPFVIVFYFWRKPLFYLADSSVYEGMSVAQIIKSYLSVTTTGALWFLYVLFVIFVGQRLLVKMIWKNNKTIAIWFGLFSLASILSYKLSGPVHHVMLYNVYFFLGSVLHKYKDKFWRGLFPIFGIVAIIGTASIVFLRPMGFIGSLITFVLAIVDIYLAFELSKRCEHIFTKSVSYISDLSMGIYLFHEPIIVAIGSKLPDNLGGVLLTLSFSTIGLVFSVAMIVFLRKIKLGFVIGE